MGPSAVDGKLDLTLKAVGNVLEFDLPNVIRNLGHLVCSIGGIPCSAVQPCAFAVTNCKYSVVFKIGDGSNVVAGHISVALCGIIHYSKGSGAGHVKGYVVAGRIADPLSAVLDGLELNSVESLVNGVILGVGTIGLLGHQVGFVGAVPTCAEDLRLRTCYDADIICRRFGRFLGRSLRRSFGRSLGGSFGRSLGRLRIYIVIIVLTGIDSRSGCARK